MSACDILDAILCTKETAAKETEANFCCRRVYNADMILAWEVDNEQEIVFKNFRYYVLRNQIIGND